MREKEYLDNFEVLNGFTFYEAYNQFCESTVNGNPVEDTLVTTLRFVNERNVEIDVFLIDGELQIGEPFAIDNEFEPLEKERIMFKGIEYKRLDVKEENSNE